MSELETGCRIMVKKKFDSEEVEKEYQGEILAIKLIKDEYHYYVHYIGYNKRLDEWVDESKLLKETMSKPTTNVKKKGSVVSSPRLKDAEVANGANLKKGSQEKLEEPISNVGRGQSIVASTNEISRVKNVGLVEIGRYQAEAWYFSPYPDELTKSGVLYLCETCLEPQEDRTMLRRHRNKCRIKLPPGKEIYRHKDLSLYEVDGNKQTIWCRNLSLLSKLFLDHKTLYYDVNPFLFYPLIHFDETGGHIVGYFSKEKKSAENYNVACILTLPHHQKKGYGKLLIGLSYELSKIQGIPGSPEKPLSDLGLLSYRSYWTEVILNLLLTRKEPISIDEISKQTAITQTDVIHTLHALKMFKYYKGNHIIVITQEARIAYERTKAKKSVYIASDKLIWSPPVFSPTEINYV